MTIFGIDVSHHQGGSLNFQGLRLDGIEFAFLKATEGAGFVDSRFFTNLRKARDAGMLVGAYHYVREGTSVQAQAANVRRVVPTDVPVILDVEDGSGTLPRVRTFVGLLRDAGYRVPLLYLPRWYWQRLGSPDLTGLPPLWSSRYPDNTVDDLVDEFARVPSHYWTGYGGLDVAVLQFTSSARVAGYAPLDANAFRGTREQLSTLLGHQEKRKSNVRNLLIAHTAEDAVEHWVGDGLGRRRIADAQELSGLVWWIGLTGGDNEIKVISDLRVLGDVGVPVQLDYARFVTDVVEQVSERVSASVIDNVLAALETRGLGATVEQVEEVVREVFHDAGTGDE